jgi:hypothetical protein
VGLPTGGGVVQAETNKAIKKAKRQERNRVIGCGVGGIRNPVFCVMAGRGADIVFL